MWPLSVQRWNANRNPNPDANPNPDPNPIPNPNSNPNPNLHRVFTDKDRFRHKGLTDVPFVLNGACTSAKTIYEIQTSAPSD